MGNFFNMAHGFTQIFYIFDLNLGASRSVKIRELISYLCFIMKSCT